jgi:peptidoglycan hydrolase CwlO-like protein
MTKEELHTKVADLQKQLKVVMNDIDSELSEMDEKDESFEPYTEAYNELDTAAGSLDEAESHLT